MAKIKHKRVNFYPLNVIILFSGLNIQAIHDFPIDLREMVKYFPSNVLSAKAK